MTEFDIKLQSCMLCDALVRNINNNFFNISFGIREDKMIIVKFILTMISAIEEDLIDDIIAEYSATQDTNCVLSPVIVKLGENILPLDNIVYSVRGNG